LAVSCGSLGKRNECLEPNVVNKNGERLFFTFFAA